MRVVFFGVNLPFSHEVLAQLRTRHTLVGVVEAGGAGQHPPGLLRRSLQRVRGRRVLAVRAAEAGAPHHLLTREGMSALPERVRAWGAEVGVIAYFPRLLPRAVIDAFPLGLLNVHPSRLPDYRGPLPVFWEYARQEAEGGVTVHFIDEGEDTGDIVRQAPVPIRFGEDGEDHMLRCAEVGGELVVEALDALAAGTLERRSQRELPCGFRARSIRRGENVLDWHRTPIEQVFHTLRGGSSLLDQLLPPPPPPFHLLDLYPDSFERGTVGVKPGEYRLGLGAVSLGHPDGHIRLRARLSPGRLRLQLRSWLQRAPR